MHYEEQKLMREQLAESEKTLAELEAFGQLTESNLKQYVAIFRRICEWNKKAPTTGEWAPLGDALIRMLEASLAIAESAIDE